MYFLVCSIAASDRVARLDKRREAIGGQLRLRGIRQWPAEETRRPGKLLGASDAVEVARAGDQGVTRGDVSGRADEPLNDLLPRRVDVGS